jgi:hypothetical protein
MELLHADLRQVTIDLLRPHASEFKTYYEQLRSDGCHFEKRPDSSGKLQIRIRPGCEIYEIVKDKYSGKTPITRAAKILDARLQMKSLLFPPFSREDNFMVKI